MPSPKALFTRAREKRPALDHLVRAASRYQADTGDRLAAAVTFFGFLSFFPLLALSVSLLAVVLGDDATDAVIDQVNAFAPGLAEQLELQDLLQNNTRAGVTGLLSLVGLLFSGLGWVDALREALRTVWHQNVRAGNFLKKKALDVVILAGLGATLVVSLLVSAAAGAFTDVALRLVGLEGSTAAAVLVTLVGTLLGLLTSTGLFLYLFLRLPKVQTPWRKVIKGAVLAAVLFELLKRVGVLYIERTTENPLYGAFAVVVGLLVWINIVSRMLLFCAAWTVTAPYDSDVAPSGTADPEQARKAGIPLEFADSDPDHPPAVLANGAPSPLLAALQGARPPQDEPEGPPSAQQSEQAAARRATDDGHPPTGEAARSSDGRQPGGRSPASARGLSPAGAGRTPAEARAPAGAGPNGHSAGGVATLPGQTTVRRAGQAGAALAVAGAAGVGLYALRTAAGVLRR
jgi:membrane protein